MSILHVYSNKIFISLLTQPLTHTHNPHRYHTRIHTTHRQKTRKTNPAKWIKTQLSRSTSRLEQQHRRLRWRWWEREIRLTPPVAKARTRNKIDASKGKRWRWRWRWRETFNPIQPETHWSSPFNPKTMRNKGRKSDRQRWRSTEARGRKIDQMRGRKKELCAWERERGS